MAENEKLSSAVADNRQDATRKGDNGAPAIVPGENLAAKLAWIKSNAISNGSYIVEINVDESINPQHLKYDGRENITITLKGIDANRTIRLSSNGALFEVSSGITLVLDSNITLHGRVNNDSSLVGVFGGALIMNPGSAIINNKYNTGDFAVFAGGVHVGSGIFTILKVPPNTSTPADDPAVLPEMFPSFMVKIPPTDTPPASAPLLPDIVPPFMNGGTISDNTANGPAGGVGVLGVFNMKGGIISGNTVQSHSVSGGGVQVCNTSDGKLIGIFTKTGGTITGYGSDTVNGNVVKDASGTQKNGYGHAVAGLKDNILKKFKDITVGPEENMSYNAGNGDATGAWDEEKTSSGGCYIATCVYGSYDCPEVWTLRRYRDGKLSASWFGRFFIRVYYAVSPKIIGLFGNMKWFNNFWRPVLNKFVNKLQHSGMDSSPYSG